MMMKLLIVVALAALGYVFAQNCAGCTDEDGTCRDPGYERKKISNDKNFCEYEKCYSNHKWNLFKFKCYYEPTDTCMEVTDSVTTGICSKVVCTQTESGGVFRDSQINGCEANNGECQPVGATGFSHTFEDGSVGENCECKYVQDGEKMVYLTDCGGNM